MKSLGIGLASLLSTRCSSLFSPTCYEPAPLTTTPAGSFGGTAKTPEHERLRRCWLELDELAERTQNDSELGMQASQELIDAHRTALDALVAAGALSAEVADLIQLAFKEAAGHVWATYAPLMCYREATPNYHPVSSGDLVRQAELLAESSDVDPDTIALAQTAIARDMAFLGMSTEEIQALYRQISQEHASGTPYPHFEEIDLDVSPQAAQAAQFLVELLLED